MFDPRLDKLARVLVNYSLGLRKDQEVQIGGPTIADPLVCALYREILVVGAHPWVRLQPEACKEISLRTASDAQLGFCSPIDKYIISNIDAYIGIWAYSNTKALTGTDPSKQSRMSQARKPYMDIFFKRAGMKPGQPGRLAWVGTAYPTHAAAQDAEMSLSEYADFVFTAGKLDRKDPAAEWRKLGQAQQRLINRLAKGRELHVTAPGGTDIRFGIEQRIWINCDGHENFPDGEVFTAPIEDSVEGTVHYTFPAVYGGREVQDIRLKFRGGRVVECSAGRNEEFLIQMLDQDRGARTLGELALGTNYSIQRNTKDTLFDEKIGGTFHAALGAAYPESGGKNKSGLHWDMVCDLRQGGVIELDDKPISRNGRFLHADWPR